MKKMKLWLLKINQLKINLIWKKKSYNNIHTIIKNKKNLKRKEKKKGEEDIHEHGEEEKELRREEGMLIFLYMGKKKKKKGGTYIVKLRILDFLFRRFTLKITQITFQSVDDFVCKEQ
jgi:predicted patatin/cPLA2 family phospholipase